MTLNLQFLYLLGLERLYNDGFPAAVPPCMGFNLVIRYLRVWLEASSGAKKGTN